MKKHHDKQKEKKKVPAPSIVEATVGELAVASILQAMKQMRTDIAQLPTLDEKIKAQRELIVGVMQAVPQVRRKAPIMVLHVSDQMMADIAALPKVEDRLKELNVLLKQYYTFVEQPTPQATK